MKAEHGLNLLVGTWLLFSPTVFSLGVGGLEVNAVFFGMTVIVLSVWSLLIGREHRVPARLNLLVGAWMFISTWLLGHRTAAGLWNGTITGGLLLGFSMLRLTRSRMIAVPGDRLARGGLSSR
jgi:uncharacterized membrane protein (UPF0136 family)